MASHRRTARRAASRGGGGEHRPPPIVWLGFAILLATVVTITYRLSTTSDAAGDRGIHLGSSVSTTVPPATTVPPETTLLPGTTLSPETTDTMTTARNNVAPRPTREPATGPTTVESASRTRRASTTLAPVAQTSLAPAPRRTAAGRSPTIEPAVQRFSGRLSYPNDVATSYSFDPAGGPVVLSGHWPAGAQVRVTISCRRPRVVAVGPSGFSVRFSTIAGDCQLSISQQSLGAAPTSYAFTVRYPIIVTP